MDGSFLAGCSLTGGVALAGGGRGEGKRGRGHSGGRRAVLLFSRWPEKADGSVALMEWCVWSFSGDGGRRGSDGVWFMLVDEERGEAVAAVRLWWFHRRGERKREVGWNCKKNEKSRVLGSNVIEKESIGFNLDRRIRSK
ncbi:hypothetical protein HAX54_048067 [Datura stramonium]|uniref:Uncharacterized protein n=1 Tax=Datura stramonium TaxID=4076 RepID=A0ABS8RQA3_DATST|nr:hypothetical protein [Datura stramonium]